VWRYAAKPQYSNAEQEELEEVEEFMIARQDQGHAANLTRLRRLQILCKRLDLL
jgi:hypothetical protein